MHYYWNRRDKFNITVNELKAIGITGDVAQVDERLVPVLKKANEAFKKHGYELIVKDGYRSPELYELVKKKRYENDGKENTDKTLNPKAKPHASGQVVDINLVGLKTGTEIKMWDKADWPDGSFVGYYKSKPDEESQRYQKLQELMINEMLKLGFKLGSLNEFWHFDYRDKIAK